MSVLSKYVRLPAPDRRLLRSACWRLLVAWIALRFAAFDRLLARTEATPGSETIDEANDPEKRVVRICWAVEAVAARLPGMGNCLVKALAAGDMLRSRGLPGTLRIGATRGASTTDGLNAHAWIEFNGRALVGGPDVSQYEVLTRRESVIDPS